MSTTLQAVKNKGMDATKKERRTKQIRITEKTYRELAKLGDVTDDFEDVVARLLKEHKEREQGKK
jgi:hypothetical protein